LSLVEAYLVVFLTGFKKISFRRPRGPMRAFTFAFVAAVVRACAHSRGCRVLTWLQAVSSREARLALIYYEFVWEYLILVGVLKIYLAEREK